jgi:hypothetical protein
METYWRVLMEPDRERLAATMQARRVNLDLQWKDVAKRMGMSEANLHRIRTGQISLTPDATAAIERALEWEGGSVQKILSGAEPTHMSASSPRATSTPEPPTAHSPQISTLPLAAQDVLDQGELLDTEVIDLSRPGAEFHLLVVAKVGIKDDQEKREKMREVIEHWVMLRKGIRDMADYRPGADPETDTSSDASGGNG